MKNFKWDKKYLYWGVTAFCVVMASIFFFWILNTWSGIKSAIGVVVGALTPVIYGLLIAYLLNKVVVVFETHVFSRMCARLFKNKVKARKAARIFSITLTMILALGIIAALLVIILPELYNSVVKIVLSSQDYLNAAVAWVEKAFDGYDLEPVAAKWLETISDKVVNWLENNVLPRITTLITSITDGVISVVMTLVNLFVGIVISVYLLYNKETFCAQAKKLTYSVLRTRVANTIMQELDAINDAFGSYIVGTLIDATIVGLLNYIFMTVMMMPYTGLITIMIAVTNLIPVFGPFIGAIPSGVLLLLENPTQCLIFLIFTVVLQQVDGQILKPRIHSSRTGLSGFWIMFAILFFGGLFGIMGMVIGVPVTTVLYNLFRRLNNRRLKGKGLPEETDSYRLLEYVDPVTKQFHFRPSRNGNQQETPDNPPETPDPEPAKDPEPESGDTAAPEAAQAVEDPEKPEEITK